MCLLPIGTNYLSLQASAPNTQCDTKNGGMVQGRFQEFAQGGARFRARSARDFFSHPPEQFSHPPEGISGGCENCSGGCEKKIAHAKLAQGGAKLANGGGGQTLINRHNTVIKPFKFSRKGLGVLDNFLLNT